MPERSPVRSGPALSGPARFALLLVGMLFALSALQPGTVAAQEANDAPAAAPIPVDGGVRFVAGEGEELLVDGTRHYLDTLELLGSGATLVNELGMEAYVAGVAEMPSRWPLEALKAQAVAARTYAWYSMRLDSFEGYHVCATTACQVFRGNDVVRDGGERWAAAVEATAGQVLTDAEGEPILARYFSTSGGHTYANEEVFPNSGPRPYLVGIDDPDDEVSPYHRWSVTFTREEFDDLLSRGERLAATVPVADVERLGEVRDQGAAVRVTGQDGTEVEVGADELRDFLSLVAPDRYPDRFPSRRNDGLRPLPSTIPSSRYEIIVSEDEVVIDGQGWGHGVGMGQYGAQGRADRGQSYQDILAAYYNGLTPAPDPDLPARIRVGIDIEQEVSIRAAGIGRIETTDGTEVVARALGTWRAHRTDDGWTLYPPAGTDADLEVSQTRAVDRNAILDAVTLEADVNKPVTLRLEVRRAGSDVPLVDRPLGVGDAGTHTSIWRFVDDDGEPVTPGEYEVALLGADDQGTEGGAPATITVTQEAIDAADAGSGGGLFGMLPIVTIAAIALPAAALLAIILAILAYRKARA